MRWYRKLTALTAGLGEHVFLATVARNRPATAAATMREQRVPRRRYCGYRLRGMCLPRRAAKLKAPPVAFVLLASGTHCAGKESGLIATLLSFFDPATILHSLGPYALLAVIALVFAETGLLLGFVLPGDTLLLVTGMFTHPGEPIGVAWWLAGALIAVGAFLGGELGFLIGRRAGPRIVAWMRTGGALRDEVAIAFDFFDRHGGRAVIAARFLPVVRTMTPVAAGVADMARGRYSALNLLGAVAWAMGIVFAGWALGFVPPVADFVQSYLDLLIAGAVLVGILPTVFRFIRRHRLGRAAGTPTGSVTEPDTAEERD